MQIAQQLADCCCRTNNAITALDGNLKLSICQQTHQINDTANTNALMLRDAGQNNTQAIMGKLDQIQAQALQDKLDALREKNSSLLAQLSNEHQTQALQAYQAQLVAPFGNALGVLQKEVAGIKCKLPDTATVQYSPVVGVPTCVAAQMGLYGANGTGFWG